jgi:hypothetical protein
MATIHDRLVAALMQRGAKPTTAVRTGKYTVLEHPMSDGKFLFVGKAGALRVGRTATDSVAVPQLREKLLRT